MATVGLKGIWGLEQLDRTGIATWKLGVLFMGGGLLLGVLLGPIEHYIDFGLFPTAVLLKGGFVIGLLLSAILGLSRTTE